MEPRPEETAGEDSGGRDSTPSENYRRLARAILVRAAKDLGSHNVEVRKDIMDFVREDHFSDLCCAADWGDEWVRELMYSVDALRSSVRREIAAQVGRGLSTIANIQE